METVSVSALKNNPSQALRMAHQGVVLVMNRDKPDTLMVGIESAKVLDANGVRPALATALFKDGNLSLARAAALAHMPVGAFVSHLSRLGIEVVSGTADDANQDMDTLDEWLASS
jgi:predicted HTH domain antitoxin